MNDNFNQIQIDICGVGGGGGCSAVDELCFEKFDGMALNCHCLLVHQVCSVFLFVVSAQKHFFRVLSGTVRDVARPMPIAFSIQGFV